MDDRVRDAYASRADEYLAALGSMDSVHPDDRALVSAWAQNINGRVLDAGCGPGHWTEFIHTHGVEVEGVDIVPEFIAGASTRFPNVPFRVGELTALGVSNAALHGLLSWYSIIHTQPSDVAAVLAEFARCLGPGGQLVLAFFEGPEIEAFDHAVVTAYRWPVTAMTLELNRAGFDVMTEHTRRDVVGQRPHAALVAQRREPEYRHNL
jgi:ubiquinone/menaquinone biosynthesis C-methylase UbiE